MATHELTLGNYQKQLNDNIKSIYDNFMEILKTKTEHADFEVQVRSAEIVRSYQSIMQLVSEVRTFLIINDQDDNRPPTAPPNQANNQLIRLRDEMSMFLYELEIPLQHTN